MYQKNSGNELLTKENSFDDVFRTITPMINYIAAQVDGVYGLETEDIMQELSIQAYNAWEKWEPGRGTKFSTYVFDALINKKNSLVRVAKAQKRNSGLAPSSLDEPLENNDAEGSYFCLYDVLTDIKQDPGELAQVVEIWDAVERALASMQEKGRVVVRALLSGYTQVEVSRFTGTAQPLVSYYLRSFRAKVKAELGRGERE